MKTYDLCVELSHDYKTQFQDLKFSKAMETSWNYWRQLFSWCLLNSPKPPPRETTLPRRAGTCHYLNWIKLRMEGDLNHRPPPPPPQSGLPSPWAVTPDGIMLSDSSIVQMWGRLLQLFFGGGGIAALPGCYLVLHITAAFSFPQGDQKSQSAKAKKSSAGDGKGSLTRIFKMVKLFVLFSWRQEWSRIDNGVCPYRLTVSFLFCPASVMRSAAEWVTDARRGSAYSMCICAICFVDILISLQRRENDHKRLLEAMIKAMSFMLDMLIQSQCGRATANVHTDNFLKYEYI